MTLVARNQKLLGTLIWDGWEVAEDQSGFRKTHLAMSINARRN
jgi:hypothetical protein